MPLIGLKTINSDTRITSLDFFRALAIMGVVCYHYNATIPYGFIGVDLFFVISGILIGGILIKSFSLNKPIQYWKFILQRGGKIWPSYYFFIGAGSLIAWLFYHKSNPDQIIPLWDIKRYLLFYQNYTGTPFHWSFDHIWSICVEEHFYILLPLVFIIIQRFFNSNFKLLVSFAIVTILLGFIAKCFMLYYTNGKDTYSATHNRIDALAWGVLIAIILNKYGEFIKTFRYTFFSTLIGLIGFIITIYITLITDNVFFHKVILHSILPIWFSLMILGVYYINFGKKAKPLSFIAYYSYNWYLWHPLFSIIISNLFEEKYIGFAIYLIGTFIIAVMATIFVEEPFLKLRARLLGSSNSSLKVVESNKAHL